MRIGRYFRRSYYQLLGPFVVAYIYRWRRKENDRLRREPHRLEISFRALENNLRDIKFPGNEFNKLMSLLLADIKSFQNITQRFRKDRFLLSIISREDLFLRRIDSNRRSYPSHPLEDENYSLIKIDTQSLFVFGMILVNRISLLLKLYLSDKSSKSGMNMYAKIGWLYFELNRSRPPISPLGEKFKHSFLVQLKWLYAVLRFYRNEFIEHLDKGYQQGMNFGFYKDDFSLSCYKWNYGDEDDTRVEKFRKVLLGRGIKFPERDGHRSLVNRYFVQQMFYGIETIPDDLLKEALDLIEDIGGESPKPEEIIIRVENYVDGVLLFMKDELANSELEKYRSK